MSRAAAVPPPTTATTRRSMQGNRGRDTSVELSLRRALHWRGLRYRVHRRPVPGLRCEPDILFSRARVAVFVDGCWWHGCPVHWAPPKANREWWTRKIARNVERDRDHDRALTDAGWTVFRVWEHDGVEDAADEVAKLVKSRQD
jgi:DNA mismatch endonuclease, patch repair protein